MALTEESSLLIYAPVALYRSGDELFLESQACNGLKLWAENFESVTVMFQEEVGPIPPGWQSIETLGSDLARIRIVPLPVSYKPSQFFRRYNKVRKLIREEITKATYLSFAIGGLVGDWGAVACYQAHRMSRPYAVWTDRVESEVTKLTARRHAFGRKLRAKFEHRPMAWLERFIIRRASLGLFHGKDTYNAYAPHCAQPHLVHNIHLNKSEHISTEALEIKASSTSSGPLKIIYAGRADEMKGPQDWVEVLKQLDQAGIDFSAEWLGDGPQLSTMKKLVKEARLTDRVNLPGFVSDRKSVLAALTASHIFLFCHKTPESPRCLIEALACGTPIVGYYGAFAADLLESNQGGQLVPQNDVDGLSASIIAVDKLRTRLRDLVIRASKDGAPFDAESVFKHRAQLILEHL